MSTCSGVKQLTSFPSLVENPLTDMYRGAASVDIRPVLRPFCRVFDATVGQVNGEFTVERYPLHASFFDTLALRPACVWHWPHIRTRIRR